MSGIVRKRSNTECLIAVESDEEIDAIDGDMDDIERSVSQVLSQVIESVESVPKIVEMDDILCDPRGSDTNVVIPEDSDVCRVAMSGNEDESDLEAEDCMLIDELSLRMEAKEVVDVVMDEESDDDIEFLEEHFPLHIGVHVVSPPNRAKAKDSAEEVIDLSDDEECLIINDSFTNKLNKLTKFGDNRQPKRTLSPECIPLSQPSTSSRLQPKTWTQSSASSLSSESHSVIESKSQVIRINEDTSRANSSSFWESYEESKTDSMDDSIPFLYEDEPKPSTSGSTFGSDIEDIDLISRCVKLDRRIVQSVLNLIEDQCTLPFICRYRQSAISGIDADKVRRINAIYNELKSARERAQEVERTLSKQERLNPRLSLALKRCKNVFEVEHLYQLCCNESESSERYRNLGLSDSANDVLEGKPMDPKHFVQRFSNHLDSVEAIEEGWTAIIADTVSKDCDVLEYMIAASKEYIPTLEVMTNDKKILEMRRQKEPRNQELIQKYLRFGSFKKAIDRVNAHSYMAIERGEKLGLLNVYIRFETIIMDKLIDYCLQRWNRCPTQLLIDCVRIAFEDKLMPSLQNYIRWELRHSAHMTALDVFRTNVKHLLLEPPLRGETVIGVDPGYDSGYKVAVVSPWRVPLECKILKLNSHENCEISAAVLRKLLASYNCSVIALGNGTGCRQFEELLNVKIGSNYFKPIDVKYKIISESGVSWYSVTEEAKNDLPHFKPYMIGAISIARRLIDPLSELVKVDPKRLQVGMYMRDIDEKEVKKAFHEVSVECVSYCGVDVNVASVELLSKVSGLEPTIAQMLKDKREREGLITSRSQLRTIGGITWKQFEQCAGFVKIMPDTRTTPKPLGPNTGDSSSKRMAVSCDDYDPLDSTIIHPEAYNSADIYLELIGATKQDIGRQLIRTKINNCYDKYSLPEIAQLCNTDATNMKLIIEGLSNNIDFDYRINFARLYVPDVQHFNDLSVDMRLKGRVMNVTPMGAFIDCGIVGGVNAYLNTHECLRHSVDVNDNVIVKVVSIDNSMKRFKVSVINVIKTNVKLN